MIDATNSNNQTGQMDQTDRTDQKDQKDQMDKIYQIGEARYRLEPLSWQQNKWLAEHIFKNIDLERLDFATIWDLFRAQGPLIMAISLIQDGSTRAEHSRRPFQSISLQAEQFAAELTGAEVAAFAPHFFQCCRPDQLAMLIPGKTLQRQFLAQSRAEAGPSPAPGGNGSSAASSRSVEETLAEFLSSSPDGGPPTPSPTSGDASSERPSTAPSLAGSASSSPG